MHCACARPVHALNSTQSMNIHQVIHIFGSRAINAVILDYLQKDWRQILKKNIFILFDSHFCFWSIFSVLFRPIKGVNLKLDPSSFHQSSTFITLEFQGPYGPLKNSSPCGGLARFAHKDLGSFCISGNKKQRCD